MTTYNPVHQPSFTDKARTFYFAHQGKIDAALFLGVFALVIGLTVAVGVSQ
ncbi:hypothetical protein AMC83_CH01930 [Rhizobium phaseoli]|uniref:hypothetical protein n=1 Tax=Rhizobium phaseoli TaxID=396 RepID=UPI0007F16A7F|nr:hypothetical protein [Rhizobium phaseoli]ANL71913.1 hypothetical protein AMC83_CH01930 [Rhizobium phaseoli]